MKRAALGLSFALLVAGCVHGDNVEKVHAGMDRTQVASIMGPPDGQSNEPGRECAYYTVLKDFMSRTPWTMSDRYYVCYADGKVDTFGKVEAPKR
ncbi:MAG: outer membrane protein assembly factor BamE [Proteobacteria bacterium]|nr:outer membrane protein assembly factor BamE [Pseudomonadota bacterium]